MWEDLYAAYQKELLAFGIRLCGSREAAEDLLQETFLKAWLHMQSLTDLSGSQRRAWLYRTYKNLFFDRCRRAALEQAFLQNAQPQTAQAGGIPDVETALFLQAVSPQDRVLFQLRYLEGYTAREIAELLGLPPGTVRSRLSRCRSFLKSELKSERRESPCPKN